jgi:hypothetical protein
MGSGETLKSVKEAIRSARQAAEAGDFDRAWDIMSEHRMELVEEPSFAWAWLVLADDDPGGPADPDDLEAILDAWWSHPRIVLLGVDQLMASIDGRPADQPIPLEDPSGAAIDILIDCLESLDEKEREDLEIVGALWNSLGNAYRLAGPSFDQVAQEAHERALAIDPGNGWWWFNYGLLHKHRGNWSEGLRVFRKCRELVDNDDEPLLWNLAICATAAGEVDVAIDAWRALGLDATLGHDGLPMVEGLGEVKARLSTGGIGSAHPGVGPVDFEHVWVRPSSPCHGRVLNPTLYEVGVELDDTILWDGAPIGTAVEGDRRVPRFPFLTRLRDGGVRAFLFQALQEREGQIAEISDELPGDSHLYVFEEQVRVMCPECLKFGASEVDPEGSSETHRRVNGKLLYLPAPAVAGLSEVRDALEGALGRLPGVVLAVPSLYLALGDAEGADRHRSLMERMK